ncbi:hypothetical protein SAMN02745133_02998 [Desulforamulus putei DSM 12395]|uniref:Uncharacterized protein n=1 Tax=Desulforamulus putei DSM 12395 TaxID=1121429 RepID=A0A1M5CQK9_9FIRM|nr:hypothetical protein [Desulforamulus putei]SHF56998.1 hypothetical protein SAMN02745133_02998 [Desulforamulus putei DSM 12395]
MDTNEQLYVDLMMDRMPEDLETKYLISQGYLTENMQHTEKAIQFINSFLDEKKEIVCQAFKELGPDARKSEVMKKAGIVQMGVLVDVANRLVKEGRLKKENGKVYVLD